MKLSKWTFDILVEWIKGGECRSWSACEFELWERYFCGMPAGMQTFVLYLNDVGEVVGLYNVIEKQLVTLA